MEVEVLADDASGRTRRCEAPRPSGGPCGAGSLEASSGKVVHHRLNRGGARQANNVLYPRVITRHGQPRLH